MLRKLSVVVLSAGALALTACSSSSPGTPDSGTPAISCTSSTTPTCTISASATESAIDSAIAGAVAGTTFSFAAGTFEFTNTIAIPAVANLSFFGAGMGQTILDFGNQTAGADGMDATLGNANIRFENFTIRNTAGDAIKVENGNGVVFYMVQVQWVNPADGGFRDYSLHGAYGIYPVQSQNVLIDHCQIMGARDTGAYIGQSYNIVVSNNTVFQNVAGIEIESSINAVVTNNVSTQNAAGILVFGLPNLNPPPGSGAAQDGTNYVTVSNNQIDNNNTVNFADPSGVVAAVPGGTAFFVMAANNVEVVGNTVTNNNSAGSAVISYCLYDPVYCASAPAATNLEPFSHNVFIHGNTFSGNGAAPTSMNQLPDGGVYSNNFGSLFGALVTYGGFGSSNAPVADVIWDGLSDNPAYVPPAANATDAGSPPNPQGVWVEGNTDAAAGGQATWANINFTVTLPDPTNPSTLNPSGVNLYGAPFQITDGGPAGFPLPAIDAGILP